MWSRISEAWKRARDRRSVRWAVDASLILLVFASVTLWQTRKHLDSGEQVPAFTLTDLDGRQWNLAELRGKPTVISFWAPWCGVCKAESDNVSWLRKSIGDDVNVVSIALGYRDLGQVRRFVTENAVDYPVLLGNDEVQAAFRINSFPTTYFIDEDGTIRRSVAAYTTRWGLRLRTWF